jgi:NAD(P)-dependent dehydrogenase (short-subunit alcohol dehydrogenase family)
MRFAAQVAIISGAAPGMGAAAVRILAREVARFVIADMSAREGSQPADGIGPPPASDLSTGSEIHVHGGAVAT